MVDGLDQVVGPGMMRKVGELVNGFGKRSAVHVFFLRHAEDFGMFGALEVDAIFEKIFTQFVTGTRAGKVNVDIAVGFET